MSVVCSFVYLMQAKSLPESCAKSLAEFFEAVNVENAHVDVNSFLINGKEVQSVEDIKAAANHPFEARFDFDGSFSFGARMYVEDCFGVLQEDEAVSVIVYEETEDFTYIRTYGDVDETDVNFAELPEDKQFNGMWPGVYFKIPKEKLQLKYYDYGETGYYDFEFADIFDAALAQELKEQYFYDDEVEEDNTPELGEVFSFGVNIFAPLSVSYLDTVNRLYQQMRETVEKYGGVMEPHTSNEGNPYFTFADCDDMIEVRLSVGNDGMIQAEAKKYTFSEKL